MFKDLPDDIVCDAAFLYSLLDPAPKTRAIPIKMDGMPTVAFCIVAGLVGDEKRQILHPVAIVPHKNMVLQDWRGEKPSAPLGRAMVIPTDVWQGKLYKRAMEDPEAFFTAERRQ